MQTAQIQLKATLFYTLQTTKGINTTDVDHFIVVVVVVVVIFC